MIFSTPVFLWLFLPAVVIINFIFHKSLKLTNIFLVLASLIFYAWGEPVYVLLMLFSIFINWILGQLIDITQGKKKSVILIVDVVINLALLFYFKYFDFLLSTLNRLFSKEVFTLKEIALPIGISFFTFQAMSYVIDVYRGNCKAQKNILNLALYISFFPQLIAGPIVRYQDIELQIENRSISIESFAFGFKRFLYGLSKKVIIANCMAKTADTIFSMDEIALSSAAAWVGAITYTLQIYYDFSGYSDMAIGLGKMFGFDFLENFNYPYLSKSIHEFWQRWHISLGTWFREYVYIPLGGNKKGKGRTYFNLITVFFLTGMWHGASWHFVIWGLYHGFFQIIERIGFDKILKKSIIFSRIYCVLVFTIGWVIFRADSFMQSMRIIKRMVLPFMYTIEPISFNLFAVLPYKSVLILVVGVLGCGIIQSCAKHIDDKYKNLIITRVIEAVYLSFCLLYSMMQLVAGGYNPFIYFRF